jgi:hypothetical protein
MVEPENHTLRVLIEFRNEFNEFKTATERRFADVNRQLADFREEVAYLAQVLAGETASRRYIIGGIDERFGEIERRLALEQAR